MRRKCDDERAGGYCLYDGRLQWQSDDDAPLFLCEGIHHVYVCMLSRVLDDGHQS
jgi:hypothetical protein